MDWRSQGWGPGLVEPVARWRELHAHGKGVLLPNRERCQLHGLVSEPPPLVVQRQSIGDIASTPTPPTTSLSIFSPSSFHHSASNSVFFDSLLPHNSSGISTKVKTPMMHHPTLCAVAVALLSALPGADASLYTKSSPVVQVDGKDYNRLIAKSNYTSVSN